MPRLGVDLDLDIHLGGALDVHAGLASAVDTA